MAVGFLGSLPVPSRNDHIQKSAAGHGGGTDIGRPFSFVILARGCRAKNPDLLYGSFHCMGTSMDQRLAVWAAASTVRAVPDEPAKRL
jgi:hypothetical protein